MAELILTALYWLILVRALISWVNPDPFNPSRSVLDPHDRTHPAADPQALAANGHRHFADHRFPGHHFLKSFLVATLFDIGMRLR